MNEATAFTERANAAVLEALPFENQEDFELARRGFIATREDLVIRTADGSPAWDLEQYAFLESEEAPDTVNPSLWRIARLNMNHGLFKITDRIYTVRGFDLSNIILIEGDTGWIVADPLISAETARAALDLANEHLGERPVVAVMHTHSHVDHWGGVRAIVEEKDITSGDVRIVAPDGFLHHAVSENVLAGNAMGRRAGYMYGTIMPAGPTGRVDSGLGKGTSTGSVGLLAPTDVITETGQELTLDGVQIVFQLTPGTEAPAEFNFFLPQFYALCIAENATATLHNLLTLRGAEVRDALMWSKYMTEAIEMFGRESQVVFSVHHWPRWGNEAVLNFLKKQRDLYKYLHDQTLRLLNQGYKGIEIAEMIALPDSLANEWFNRGYYGTVNHNVKAIYQKYMGWFDGDPANLHPLPPEQAGAKYVEYMGGADAVLARAREAYEAGEYRWVAQVVNHVVFADAENQEARELEAKALVQLGYQAESASWRNVYLAGAQELRVGAPTIDVDPLVNADVMAAMTVGMIFDYLAVRLNGPRAEESTLSINFRFPDIEEEYVLSLENSVLNYVEGRQAEDADLSVAMNRSTLNSIMLGEGTFMDLAASGEIETEGRAEAFGELLALMDKFDMWFNIVTP